MPAWSEMMRAAGRAALQRCRVVAAVAGTAALGGLAPVTQAQEIPAELIAKAKAEGRVTYYTDLIVDQVVRPLVAAFEARFGIKVDYARADSQDNILKLLAEHRAGRTVADVFSMTSGLKVLIDAGVVRQFDAVGSGYLPPQYKDPNRYWVTSHIYVMTPAVNTDLVGENQRPATFEDLLAPQWKGKIVWKPNDMSGAPGFIGNVLRTMGDEKGMDYLRRLAGQQIKIVNSSARGILDQVIAGEYPMALQIFNHHVAISRGKGAPAAWLKLPTSTITLELIGLTAKGPRPNAGLLLVEFMLSREGQTILQKANYLPVHPQVPATFPELMPEKGNFKGNVISPDEIARDLDKWNGIVKQLFR